MTTTTAGALLFATLLLLILIGPEIERAWRRFQAPRCQTCHARFLRVSWTPKPISCCSHHREAWHQEISRLVMVRLQAPPLEPWPDLKREAPHRPPGPSLWPACPSCGHHLSQLEPYSRRSSQAGTPAAGPRPSSDRR